METLLICGRSVPPFQVLSLGPGINKQGHAINSHGVVVGSLGAWVGNTATPLPTGTVIASGAYDINDHGIVVGDYGGGPAAVTPRAFRWSGGSSVQDLGTLDPACATCSSAALAINDPGFIVGHSEFHAQLPEVRHAFIWPLLFSSPPAMVDLGTLCSGYLAGLSCSSVAFDINVHNHIVGASDTSTASGGDPHAFLHKGTTMTDLNTLLAPADQADWVLREARAINDLGQIAGNGLFQGDNRRAFLLTPSLNVIFGLVKGLHMLFLVKFSSERRNLDVKMDGAEAAFERGDLEEAGRQLDAYVAEVQALLETRRLTQTHATKLTAGAALIRREMVSLDPLR